MREISKIDIYCAAVLSRLVGIILNMRNESLNESLLYTSFYVDSDSCHLFNN